METTTGKKRSARNRYSKELKQEVLLRYPLCRDNAERLALAKELGFDDSDEQAALSKLYNLASRLGATGQGGRTRALTIYDARADRARLFLREDPSTARPFSAEEDAFIRKHFPVTLALDERVAGDHRREQWQPIEQIAWQLGRSEAAISYRARQLTTTVLFSYTASGAERGMRRVPHLWDWRKVSAWLGVAPAMSAVKDPMNDPLQVVRSTYRQLLAAENRRPTAAEVSEMVSSSSLEEGWRTETLAEQVCSEERVAAFWDELSAMTEEEGGASPSSAWGYDIASLNRQRGLRLAAAYKDGKLTLEEAKQVADSLRTLAALEQTGLVLSPCTDRDGKTAIVLVSTIALLRALELDIPAEHAEHRPLWQQLVEDKGADLYFLQDLRESLALIRREGRLVGDGCWEPWRWMSHGGTSLCPFIPSSYGLVPDANDFQVMASSGLLILRGGRQLGVNKTKPSFQMLHEDDLHPHAHCEREGWQRRTRMIPEGWSESEESESLVA
jgi:hypothetical protein